MFLFLIFVVVLFASFLEIKLEYLCVLSFVNTRLDSLLVWILLSGSFLFF